MSFSRSPNRTRPAPKLDASKLAAILAAAQAPILPPAAPGPSTLPTKPPRTGKRPSLPTPLKTTKTPTKPKATGGSKRGGERRAYTAARKDVDWEQVEADYRAGVLSLRAMAYKFRMSTTRLQNWANKNGWKRDLTSAVRQQARATLIHGDAATSHTGTSKGGSHAPADIIEGAAAAQVQVVREHRTQLSKLHAIQRRLFARLDVLTGKDGGEERIRGLSMLTEAAGITESLSRNMSRLIPLERQAFSLDAKGADSPGAGVSAIEERTRSYMDEQKAAAKAQAQAVKAGIASGKVASLEDRVKQREVQAATGYGPDDSQETANT